MSEQTEQLWTLPGELPPGGAHVAPPKRRRVRGLRLTAVPSGPLTAQVAGGVVAMVGIALLWGLAVTLLVGGLSMAALGALKEAGRV
jgi:hypothetical protein